MNLPWVNADGRFRLAQQPRPRGGAQLELDLGAWASAGAEVLVTCLELPEARMLGLSELPERAAAAGIELVHFPIRDHDVPSSAESFLALTAQLRQKLEEGRGVVAHCYAGIGRSGMVVVGALVAAGYSLDDACVRATDARGLRVPETLAQRRWLEHTLGA